MLAWGEARSRFSTLRITTHFIKSSMSGRISSLHISIFIRSSTLKLQSGCWQRKRLVTRREEGQHCSNSFAASVAGALNDLKASICHDEGGFNALARQTGRRGRRSSREWQIIPFGRRESANILRPRTEMERVKFVMKGGVIIRNDLGSGAWARTR
jgi:hypothetical protein